MGAAPSLRISSSQTPLPRAIIRGQSLSGILDTVYVYDVWECLRVCGLMVTKSHRNDWNLVIERSVLAVDGRRSL